MKRTRAKSRSAKRARTTGSAVKSVKVATVKTAGSAAKEVEKGMEPSTQEKIASSHDNLLELVGGSKTPVPENSNNFV